MIHSTIPRAVTCAYAVAILCTLQHRFPFNGMVQSCDVNNRIILWLDIFYATATWCNVHKSYSPLKLCRLARISNRVSTEWKSPARTWNTQCDDWVRYIGRVRLHTFCQKKISSNFCWIWKANAESSIGPKVIMSSWVVEITRVA